MFDLFRSQKKAVRYFLGGILMIIAVSMVVTLIPGFGSTTGRSDDSAVIAQIGGTKITAQEASQQAQRILRGNQIPPEMIEVYVPQFVDSMIQQRALIYEFERLGLTATDDEVTSTIQREYAQFFQNGKFTGKDQLTQLLAQDGLTLQDVIDATRSDVLLSKIQNLQYAAIVVSPQEVDQELKRKYEKAKIEYVAFPPAKFKDQVKVSPEEIKAYYESHKGAYMTPEKRSFQVIVVDQEKVAKSIDVTDAQLRAAYSSNMDSFRTPERVHARHILIKTVDKSDAEKKQLLAKAQDLLKKVKSGGNFEELAKQNSEDPGSAAKGGDLGWITRGQTVPEFEKAIFSMKPGQISDIVTTTYGYHIIQVLEREQARVKPFDEVKASLTDEVRKQGLSDKMQALGDQVHAALEKSPASAADIARQYNVDLITVNKAAAGDAIPTLGVSPEIDGALAGLQKGGVTQLLVLPSNRLAVAVLNDRIAPKPSELSEVEGKIRDKLIDDKAGVIAAQKAKEAGDKIHAGADMKTVAKSMKLDVTDSGDFGRNDSVEGLGHAALVQDAFNKPVGTIVGPIPIQGRNVIYKILDRTSVDISKLGAERAEIASQIKQQKGQRQFALFEDSVVTKLVAEGKVKINHDAIKRLVASFRQ